MKNPRLMIIASIASLAYAIWHFPMTPSPLSTQVLLATRGANPDTPFANTRFCDSVNVSGNQVGSSDCGNSVGQSCVKCADTTQSYISSILASGAGVTYVGLTSCNGAKNIGTCGRSDNGEGGFNYFCTPAEEDSGYCSGEINRSLFQASP